MQFKDEYRFLSNFYYAKTVYKHIEYPTSEHAYQAAKTVIQEERKLILNATSPGEAKRLGQLVTERKKWKKIRVGIMTEIVMNKFSDPKLMEMLIKTKPLHLVEGNYHHDNFWGDCLCVDCLNIVGKNELGIILEKIREGIAF